MGRLSTGLLFIAVLIIVHIDTANSAGLCYRRNTRYERRAYTVYHQTSHTTRTRCGFWRRRCSRTRYGTGSNVKYTTDTIYYSTSYCCSGFYDYPRCKEYPRFTTQPVSVTNEKSHSAAFYVRVRGYGPFRYQWYHNSRAMINANNRNLYIYNLAVSDSGSYYCRVCNPDNRCIRSSTAYLTVTVNLPKVTLQPSSRIIALRVNNYNTSLSCWAEGNNIKYVWERENSTIPNNTYGSSTSTMHFYLLSPENSGKYRCKVYNNTGFGYSHYADLQIHAPAPQIIKEPVSIAAADPFGARFSCTANGYGEIEITWRAENTKRGIPSKAIITEERSLEYVTSTMFIPDVVMQDEGGYYCSAQIGLMSGLSQTAYLEAIMTPMIKVKMDNNEVNLLIRNYNLTMQCHPTKTDLYYRWNRKNASLPASAVGLNTSTMTIYRLTPDDAGNYQCMLSNISGVIASEYTALKINVPPPEITIPPQNISTTPYTSITFTCTGRGFGDVKVIWTKPPSKVTATAVYTFNRYDDHVISTLTLNNVVGIYSGSYCCAIVNHAGSSAIECAPLKVTIPCPEISMFPINNTIIVEEQAEFTCEAFSFSKVSYKWERENGLVPGKSITDTCSSTLTIPNGTQFDEGNYCCVATNECGPVKECAVLSVIDVPTVVLHPVGTTVHVGTDEVEMSCSATGHSRISYHWERYNFNNSQWSSLTKDGQADVDGVSTYSLTNIVANDEGMYQCTATNIDGSGYSYNATITVYGPPTIELSSTKVDGVEGHDMTVTCTAMNDVDSPYDTHITWFGPTGQVIESNDDISISNIEIDNVMTSALKFEPINHTQAGINKCKATNHPNSSSEMNVVVTVEYAPIVHITPSKSPYSTEIGPEFLLHCSADGNPSPSVQWYKDGQPFTAMTIKSTQDVYIPRSSSSDSALYECIATNYPGNIKEQRKTAIDFRVIEATEGPCAVNNGGCDHICTADSNIVNCYCRVGYFSIAFIPARCFDVDECLFNLDKCEDKCTNTPGSYRCSCPYGQVLASDGYSCITCADNKASTNFSQATAVIPKNIKESMWHVAICMDNNSTVCSGSLINDNLVVTTASCVCNDNKTSTESISVKVNKNYGCPTEEVDALQYDVSQIICHPLYDDSALQYNIALLRLAVIVNTTAFAPACLPVANTDTDILNVNNFAGIYGYREMDKLSSSADGSGSESDSDTVYTSNDEVGNLDELYFQVTQVEANDDCSAAYNHSSISITNRMICTSSSGSRDCWKYSGTPLVTQSRVKDHVILAAMGYHGDAECETRASHNVHVKLDGYQEWIATQTHIRRP